MKKVIFTLVALVASMSMNAQTMKVMKGNVVVATYTAEQADNVVFEEASANPLLSGSFSVSANKTVKFTRCNLYWDGSALKFETNPTDYPTTREATHIGHFFWTKTAAASYAESFNEAVWDVTDKFFADGSDASHTLSVEGIDNLYVLSSAEWEYLLNSRTNASSLYKYGVTVNDGTKDIANCLIIAPDTYDFSGENALKSSYTLTEIKEKDFVCLPPAGWFTSESNSGDIDDQGYCWSSTPYATKAGRAHSLRFVSDGAIVKDYGRINGFSLRLVQAEEEINSTTTGTAKRTGDIDVTWIQLWEDGPKFAEYNVGAANNKAEDYGGYYAWGGSQDKFIDDYNTGSVVLSGDNDTATKLWGSAWRMPTKAELDDLLANCDVEWTTDYKGDGTNIKGRIFTGKGAYASNSIFLPAAGYYTNDVWGKGKYGMYWSSKYRGNDGAYRVYFASTDQQMAFETRVNGYSVRAVLAE